MKAFWIASLVFFALLAGCQQSPANLAPPFQGLATDGKHYSLLDVTKRRPLIVFLFESEDKSSLELANKLGDLEAKHNQKLQLLGVTTVPELLISEFGDRNPTVLPTIGDMDRAIAAKYSLKSFPAWIVVDVNGELVYAGTGEGQQLSEALKRIKDLPSGFADELLAYAKVQTAERGASKSP